MIKQITTGVAFFLFVFNTYLLVGTDQLYEGTETVIPGTDTYIRDGLKVQVFPNKTSCENNENGGNVTYVSCDTEVGSTWEYDTSLIKTQRINVTLCDDNGNKYTACTRRAVQYGIIISRIITEPYAKKLDYNYPHVNAVETECECTITCNISYVIISSCSVVFAVALILKLKDVYAGSWVAILGCVLFYISWMLFFLLYYNHTCTTRYTERSFLSIGYFYSVCNGIAIIDILVEIYLLKTGDFKGTLYTRLLG